MRAFAGHARGTGSPVHYKENTLQLQNAVIVDGARSAFGRGGRGTRYAQLFPEWIQPQLAAAFESGLGQAAGPLRATLAAIAQRGAREAHLLDQLPLFLTHADFQGKNILSLPDADAGQPGIAIIDAETAQVQSRLFDFYFLLMGDDGGSLLEDFAAFRALLAAYFEHARGLTGDEARLLGFALQAKAATIAAWTASEYHAAAPGRRQLYKTWFLRALRCIQVVDRLAVKKDRLDLVDLLRIQSEFLDEGGMNGFANLGLHPDPGLQERIETGQVVFR